jgi:two-component system phosphate regulon sensor histidine kinase PhoR
MNNKFIPVISVFMTISLIVFVTLQVYWLKGYYRALEEQFSNRVNSALESTTQKISEIEVDKILNHGDYKNFGKTIIKGANQPSQTYIQQSADSANRKTITFQNKIIENQNIPISTKGDSLKTTKVYNEGYYKQLN